MLRVTPVACLALASLLLAGCSGGGGGAGEGGFEEGFEDTAVARGKGLIRGVILDPAITPVAGATVKLAATGQEATTDEGGLFVFADLDPGTHFLDASKPGWTSTQQSVDVVADVAEPAIVKVMIQRIPGAEPRAVTVRLEGFISCSVGTPVSFHNCNTTEPQRSALFADFEGRPSAVQTELMWESTQALGDWLYVINAVCECGGQVPPDAGDERRFDETDSATSPYIVRFDGDWLDDNDAGGENAQVGVDVSASGPEPETTNGSGVALNQNFDLFVTIFYNLEPDPAWSFVANGPYPVPSG